MSPSYSYTLRSGYVELTGNGEGEFTDGPHRWTALIIKDSSGSIINFSISELFGVETSDDDDPGFTGKAKMWIYTDSGDELPRGTYTAALYTADGYTLDNMIDYLNDYNDPTTSTGNDFLNIFTETGRKISSDATLTVGNNTYPGYGWLWDDADPYVTEGSVTVRSFSGSYEAPSEGVTVYLTIVSASNPSVHLITPVKLGSSASETSFSTGALSYTGTDPVYIIIYSGTFSPENYIYVKYATSP
ncbi:MAG: hypothetical protein J5950_05460 [Clostridia bacterium]|nr:hypothetical protein [Clostridia bacterium]